MSMDGKGHVIPIDIQGDGVSGFDCECGAFVSTAGKSKFAKCGNGHVVCRVCHRQAHRFRKGFTCGIGCKPAGN